MNRGQKSKYRMVHWALGLATRKHYKIAAVALANKIARIAWAVLAKGQPFRECPQ
jgi:transposase